jgi:signal transduction histidine kinase
LNYNLKALEIAIPLKDTNSLSVLYNNMAVTYLKIGDYKSSKFYFNKTIELDLVLNLPYNTAISYSNLGVLYLRSHELEEATKSYQKVLHLLPLVNQVYVKPYLFISLVKYYTEIKNYQAALSYADSALWLCNEYHYDHIKARLFRRLGELYISQNKFQESIQYLDQCLQVSAEIGMAEALPDVYNLKAQAYSNLSLFEKAYHAQEMSQMMRDSLKSSETAIILGEYEEEQRTKNELMRQQLQHELKYQKQENTRIKMMLKFRYALIVIILLALALVIGFYLFFSLRNKNKLLQKQHLLINEQKEQLEKHNELLIKSEENLQELNATKDKFFSIIAHDLKSPFSAIIGFSDELYESYVDYTDQERKQMIRQIKNSSHNTFDLLENLLTWSQSQSGFIKLEFSALNIKNLTEKSISAYLPAAKRKNLEVKIKIDKEITAWGDEKTLKVLISNLFNNAIKFSRNNTEIILSTQRHKNYLEFCVQDFGIGMSRSILNDLFKIETNVQRSGTSNEKGTGLGLILCQEFIHKNNGKIWVESEEGKGSKFCFTLPLTKDAQA